MSPPARSVCQDEFDDERFLKAACGGLGSGHIYTHIL